MKPQWATTDILRNIEISPDGCVVRAHSSFYLQAGRDHIHTTSILLAADLVLSKLLREGEPLADIVRFQNRRLSNRDLLLIASTSRSRIPRSVAPAIRGSYRTAEGRTLYLEGAICGDTVVRRCEASRLSDELLERTHLRENRDGAHTARLEPLGSAWAGCVDPVLTRYAIVEFVLEATRRPIRERFGDIAADALVVAGWKSFAFPRWQDVSCGCVLEYRLGDGALPNGTRLVHCDFSFSPDARPARLTIARVPGARLAALKHVHADGPGAGFRSGASLVASE